jgi:hypothetical protein
MAGLSFALTLPKMCSGARNAKPKVNTVQPLQVAAVAAAVADVYKVNEAEKTCCEQCFCWLVLLCMLTTTQQLLVCGSSQSGLTRRGAS